MKIKLPSGKIVAYTVGKSVLVIKNADASIVGKDYSVRINDPDNTNDAITVAVEDGELQLESIPEEEKNGKKENQPNPDAEEGSETDGGSEESGDEPSGEPGGDDDSATGESGDGDEGSEDEDTDPKPDEEDEENGDSKEDGEDLGGDDGSGTKKKDNRRYTRIRRQS